jgi:hypothetical protein
VTRISENVEEKPCGDTIWKVRTHRKQGIHCIVGYSLVVTRYWLSGLGLYDRICNTLHEDFS